MLNEEGKLVGLPSNVRIRLESGGRDYLCGTLLVVAVRGSEWESAPEGLRVGIMAWLDERAVASADTDEAKAHIERTLDNPFW